MSVSISAEPTPLRMDETGTIRVGATRVTLDSLVAAFSQGASAEQIALDYPTLDLADVYATIAYYLRHAAELDAYLNQRREEAKRFRQANPSVYANGVRERLLARSVSRGK